MLPLPHIVSIASKIGDSSQGQPTYGSGVDYKCRFELNKTFRRLESGQTITSDAMVIIGSDVSVSEGDQVVVTSPSFTGTVIGFSEYHTVNGKSHHKELFLKAK